jgi:hypothetical protein
MNRRSFCSQHRKRESPLNSQPKFAKEAEFGLDTSVVVLEVIGGEAASRVEGRMVTVEWEGLGKVGHGAGPLALVIVGGGSKQACRKQKVTKSSRWRHSIETWKTTSRSQPNHLGQLLCSSPMGWVKRPARAMARGSEGRKGVLGSLYLP